MDAGANSRVRCRSCDRHGREEAGNAGSRVHNVAKGKAQAYDLCPHESVRNKVRHEYALEQRIAPARLRRDEGGVHKAEIDGGCRDGAEEPDTAVCTAIDG